MSLKLQIIGPEGPELAAIDRMLGTLESAIVRTVPIGTPFLQTYRAILSEHQPDLVVHLLGLQAIDELQQLATLPQNQRAPVSIILSEATVDPARIMRMAMRAGAQDFVRWPSDGQELMECVKKAIQWKLSERADRHNITAFVSPKGGAGTSFIAGSVAYALRTRHQRKTLLLDLDFQFGSQYLSFDLEPQKGLSEALENLETLDESALQGYITKHSSGLDVMGVLPNQLILSDELAKEDLISLFELLSRCYDHVIVDMPSHIDPAFGYVAERMSRILMVLQQDLSSVRFGLKMITILRGELDLPVDRIGLVINQFEKSGSISLDDMTKAINLPLIGAVIKDSEAVKTAVNLGVPVLKHAPKSRVNQGLFQIAGVIDQANAPPQVEPSFLNRLIKRIKGDSA